MKILLGFILLSFMACNQGQGYRENQEEQTAPSDYTSGKDSREPAKTRR